MPKEQNSMQTQDADVVIVGAGVAGLLAAWSLALAGVKVLVLESGPRVVRSEALRIYREAVAKVPEAPYPDVPHAPRPTVIALDQYYVQDGETFFKSTYERRVGGTTWHWLGTTLRHLPNDFQLNSLYGAGQDWPIHYEDLEHWYGEAEHAMGVAGDSEDDLGSPRSTHFPQPPLPLTYLDQQIDMAARRLGLRVRLTPQARNSTFYDGRPPCCGNATCVPICPIAAKYDGAVHAQKAEALGVEIRENCVVYQIEVGAEGRVTGVRYKLPDGSEHSAAGRIYVIAGNAIETPKLLLISRTDALPNGVANSSDMVGRNLMDHPVQLSWALAKNPLYPYRSPLENAGIEDFRDGDFRGRSAAFRMAIGEDGWSFPGTPPPALASEFLKSGIRGKELVQMMNDHVSRQFRFASLIEQMPLPENRVQPAWEQLDAIGIPRPRITYRYDELTIAGLAEARAAAERIFQAMDVIYFKHGEEPEGAGHVIGTYRMGSDPGTSVVNAEQRAHDHPNLFLLGAGVFPTAGTANPTLTLSALALWAADTIRKDLSGGG
jgi:glucose dehydrogenase